MRVCITNFYTEFFPQDKISPSIDLPVKCIPCNIRELQLYEKAFLFLKEDIPCFVLSHESAFTQTSSYKIITRIYYFSMTPPQNGSHKFEVSDVVAIPTTSKQLFWHGH